MIAIYHDNESMICCSFGLCEAKLYSCGYGERDLQDTQYDDDIQEIERIGFDRGKRR